MDPVEGLAPVGGDEPLEPVTLGHPLQEFARGHKGGVDRHAQGEKGHGGHQDAEMPAVQQGGIMGDQVQFMLVHIDGGRQGQGADERRYQPHRQRQEPVGLADIMPIPDQTGGLDHRFDPGIGQDAKRDMGDEIAVMGQPRALAQVAAGLGKGGVQAVPGAQVAKLHQAGGHQVQHDEGGQDEDPVGKPGISLDADDVQARR